MLALCFIRARIANSQRRVIGKRKFEHIPELRAVRRAHYRHIGHRQKIAQIEHTLMRHSVRAHHARAVDAERYGVRADTHVVQKLIVRALQKRGIYREIRLHAARGERGAIRYRMLLRYAHVLETFGKRLRIFLQARAYRHCRRYRHNTRVVRRRIGHKRAQNVRKPLAAFCARRRYAVRMRGVYRRAFKPATLIGNNVNEHGLVFVFYLRKNLYELADVVSVERAVIRNAHRLEYFVRQHHAL